MQKNSQNFSIQELIRLANSPAGQQLLAYLQENNPTGVKQAMSQAASGDRQELGKTLAQLLSSPQAQELMRRLEGEHG